MELCCSYIDLGGGGKALTMASDILESATWSMVKMVILWQNFTVRLI